MVYGKHKELSCVVAIDTYEIMMSNLTSLCSQISSTAAPFIVPDMR